MLKKLSSPNTVFTLLQGITVLIGSLGLAIAAALLFTGVTVLRRGSEALRIPAGSFITLAIVGFIGVAVVSIACIIALISFFLMCNRLKHGTAFTRENERAMQCITLCCLASGLALGLGCIAVLTAENIWGGAMGLYWVEMAVIACAFLAVGAVAWALCLLVRRAIPMQEEADLTV